MFTQLPEEKRDLIPPLFQKKQPNNSALWCNLGARAQGYGRAAKPATAENGG